MPSTDQLVALAAAGDAAAAEQLWLEAMRADRPAWRRIAAIAAPTADRVATVFAETPPAEWPALLDALHLGGNRTLVEALHTRLDALQAGRRARLLNAADVVAAIFGAACGGWATRAGGRIERGSGRTSICLAVDLGDGTIAWDVGTGSARSGSPRSVAEWQLAWRPSSRAEHQANLADWASSEARGRWHRDAAVEVSAATPAASLGLPNQRLDDWLTLLELGLDVEREVHRAAKACVDPIGDDLLARAAALELSGGINAFRRRAQGRGRELDDALAHCTVAVRSADDLDKLAVLTELETPFALSLEFTDFREIDLSALQRPPACTDLDVRGRGVRSAGTLSTWPGLRGFGMHSLYPDAAAARPGVLDDELERVTFATTGAYWQRPRPVAHPRALSHFSTMSTIWGDCVVPQLDPRRVTALTCPTSPVVAHVLHEFEVLERLALDYHQPVAWSRMPSGLESLVVGGNRIARRIGRLPPLPGLRELLVHTGAGPDALSRIAAWANGMDRLALPDQTVAPTTLAIRPRRVGLKRARFTAEAWVALAGTGFFDEARVIDLSEAHLTGPALAAILERAPHLLALSLAATRFPGRIVPESAVEALAAAPAAHRLLRLDLRVGLSAVGRDRLAASRIDRRAVRGVRGWVV